MNIERCKVNMILILTCSNDPSADFVGEKMTNRGLSYKRLNLDEVRPKGHLSLYPQSSAGYINDGVTEVDLEEIKVVWQRRIPRRTIKHCDPMISEYLTQEWRLLWEWWVNQIPASNILDSELHLKEASNKLLQLKRAKEIGLKTPDTLITSCPEAYKSFLSSHKSVIAKTLGGFGRILEEDKAFGTIYTNRVDTNSIPDSGSIKTAPIILQEEIEKDFELRVTVVDGIIFPCKIESQKSGKTLIDWRHYDFKNVPHSKCELPPSIEDMIKTFMNDFGIHFASFDLAVTPNGEYIFFEMNPNSQWVWIENLTGMPITDTLTDSLQSRAEVSNVK